MKILQFLKSILKGVADATPLTAIINAYNNYLDVKNTEANKTYLFTFILTLISLILFYLNRFDFEMLEKIIKHLH